MQLEFCFFFTSTWSACPFFFLKKLVHSHEHHRPYTEPQPIFILRRFATPHTVLRAQGVCVRVRASGCMYVRFRTRVLRGSNNSHFKTRALVWNLAQFVKKKKEKQKKKRHLRHTVLFLLSLHLLSTDCFQWLTFFSCGHFNIYYVFFLYIIDRLCVSMWVFHFEVPNVSTVSVRIAFAES